MEFKRKSSIASIVLLTLLGCTSQDASVNTGPATQPVAEVRQAVADDPYLWLEEVEGEQALAWVKGQNSRTLAQLQADPVYADLEAKALDIVNASERIPYGSIRNGKVYNFWQDATNVRGLWRRTTLESYGTDQPEWETIVDFDAFAKAGCTKVQIVTPQKTSRTTSV